MSLYNISQKLNQISKKLDQGGSSPKEDGVLADIQSIHKTSTSTITESTNRVNTTVLNEDLVNYRPDKIKSVMNCYSDIVDTNLKLGCGDGFLKIYQDLDYGSNIKYNNNTEPLSYFIITRDKIINFDYTLSSTQYRIKYNVFDYQLNTVDSGINNIKNHIEFINKFNLKPDNILGPNVIKKVIDSDDPSKSTLYYFDALKSGLIEITTGDGIGRDIIKTDIRDPKHLLHNKKFEIDQTKALNLHNKDNLQYDKIATILKSYDLSGSKLLDFKLKSDTLYILLSGSTGPFLTKGTLSTNDIALDQGMAIQASKFVVLDNGYIVTMDGNKVRLFTADCRLITSIELEFDSTCIDLLADGRIVVGSVSGTVYFIKVDDTRMKLINSISNTTNAIYKIRSSKYRDIIVYTTKDVYHVIKYDGTLVTNKSSEDSELELIRSDENGDIFAIAGRSFALLRIDDNYRVVHDTAPTDLFNKLYGSFSKTADFISDITRVDSNILVLDAYTGISYNIDSSEFGWVRSPLYNDSYQRFTNCVVLEDSTVISLYANKLNISIFSHENYISNNIIPTIDKKRIGIVRGTHYGTTDTVVTSNRRSLILTAYSTNPNILPITTTIPISMWSEITGDVSKVIKLTQSDNYFVISYFSAKFEVTCHIISKSDYNIISKNIIEVRHEYNYSNTASFNVSYSEYTDTLVSHIEYGDDYKYNHFEKIKVSTNSTLVTKRSSGYYSSYSGYFKSEYTKSVLSCMNTGVTGKVSMVINHIDSYRPTLVSTNVSSGSHLLHTYSTKCVSILPTSSGVAVLNESSITFYNTPDRGSSSGINIYNNSSYTKVKTVNFAPMENVSTSTALENITYWSSDVDTGICTVGINNKYLLTYNSINLTLLSIQIIPDGVNPDNINTVTGGSDLLSANVNMGNITTLKNKYSNLTKFNSNILLSNPTSISVTNNTNINRVSFTNIPYTYNGIEYKDIIDIYSCKSKLVIHTPNSISVFNTSTNDNGDLTGVSYLRNTVIKCNIIRPCLGETALIASQISNSSFTVINLDTFDKRDFTNSHLSKVISIDTNPAGSIIVSASEDSNNIILHSIKEGALLKSISVGGVVSHLAFVSADLVAVSLKTGVIKLINIHTLKIVNIYMHEPDKFQKIFALKSGDGFISYGTNIAFHTGLYDADIKTVLLKEFTPPTVESTMPEIHNIVQLDEHSILVRYYSGVVQKIDLPYR